MKKEKKQIVLNGSLLRPLSVGAGCASARRRKHLPHFACGGDSGGIGGLRPF